MGVETAAMIRLSLETAVDHLSGEDAHGGSEKIFEEEGWEEARTKGSSLAVLK